MVRLIIPSYAEINIENSENFQKHCPLVEHQEMINKYHTFFHNHILLFNADLRII